MIPFELLNILDQYHDDELNIGVKSVLFENTTVRLVINIRSLDAVLNEDWLIKAVGVRENRIGFSYGGSIDIEEDHPLLWKYKDTLSGLYFTGVCQDPVGLFFDMYQIHYSLYRTYISFEDFLNINKFNKLFELEFGLLAKGPIKLLDQYADCAKKYGLDVSIPDGRTPTYWNGSAHVPEGSNLKILLIGDTNTYIIAGDFHFEKVTNR
ncbi:MAG: hypothetical protein J0H74_36475 [Chitinophagaceae bacterium]|nr:hypothetical protein [Chitinophagaceae bacterium]